MFANEPTGADYAASDAREAKERIAILEKKLAVVVRALCHGGGIVPYQLQRDLAACEPKPIPEPTAEERRTMWEMYESQMPEWMRGFGKLGRRLGDP